MSKESKFSREEMIVVAVWYHEKNYSNMTFGDLQLHFVKRFNKDPPSFGSVIKWEKRLFTSSRLFLKRRIMSRRRVNRLVYIPYILDSLELYPDLPLKKRAGMVGISLNSLQYIMHQDMKEYLSIKGKKPGTNPNTSENCESPLTT